MPRAQKEFLIQMLLALDFIFRFQVSNSTLTKCMYLRFLVQYSNHDDVIQILFNVGQKDPKTALNAFFFHSIVPPHNIIHLLSLYLIKQMLNFRDLIILPMKWIFDHPALTSIFPKLP